MPEYDYGWVYEIRNCATGRVYIGCTQYIEQRLMQHRRHLRNGTHHNKWLQDEWLAYGELWFTMTVLEEMRAPFADYSFGGRLRQAERNYIARAERAGKVYNIHPVDIDRCSGNQNHWRVDE